MIEIKIDFRLSLCCFRKKQKCKMFSCIKLLLESNQNISKLEFSKKKCG